MKPPLDEKIRNLPRRPGVYLFHDAAGRVLYVGKAKSLRDRVRSHFRSDAAADPRHALWMSKVEGLDTIVTDSEVEALILEATLIKERRPRYNVNLRDDKSYPYLRLTTEPYPRVLVVRRIVRDGSRYFGPYTDVGSVRRLLFGIRRIFPVRTCALSINDGTIARRRHKVCLQFHIGRCGGPCEGRVSEAEYRAVVDRVVDFIEGRSDRLVTDLEARMRSLSDRQEYEEAARVRDQIRAVSAFWSRQKVADGEGGERDYAAVAAEGPDACGAVFHVRDGRLVHRRHFFLDGAEGSGDPARLAGFLEQFYLSAESIPEAVFAPVEPSDRDAIEAWLTARRGAPVSVRAPAEGKDAELAAMCLRNAQLLLEERRLQKEGQPGYTAPAVAALQKDLGLARPPRRIEAFDVSNLFGRDAAASLVVFENGRPLKSAYRRLRIRRTGGADDFAMMAEAVERRVSRLLREKQALPDLILVDGGKGQLAAALSALEKCGAADQPVLGLAKRLEEIFRPGLPDSQNLPKGSPSLRLLQQVRDEAHRFAVTYHRSLRARRSLASPLDAVPGIGPSRRRALLSHFGSLAALRNAAADDLAAVPGMNRALALRVLGALGAPECPRTPEPPEPAPAPAADPPPVEA